MWISWTFVLLTSSWDHVLYSKCLSLCCFGLSFPVKPLWTVCNVIFIPSITLSNWRHCWDSHGERFKRLLFKFLVFPCYKSLFFGSLGSFIRNEEKVKGCLFTINYRINRLLVNTANNWIWSECENNQTSDTGGLTKHLKGSNASGLMCRDYFPKKQSHFWLSNECIDMTTWRTFVCLSPGCSSL